MISLDLTWKLLLSEVQAFKIYGSHGIRLAGEFFSSASDAIESRVRSRGQVSHCTEGSFRGLCR